MPAKWLWYQCNILKKPFFEPLYNTGISDAVQIDLAFSESQPMHLYFEKPRWVRNFVSYSTKEEAQKLSRQYDFFVNNYRYRGAKPQETNVGYSDQAKELNLHVPACHYEAAFDHSLYLDDLELTQSLKAFLALISNRMNPEGRPYICLHNRGFDPWGRHIGGTIGRYVELLDQLLVRYPEHHFVLLGGEWPTIEKGRVSNLDDYINERSVTLYFGRHDLALRYILSSFFAREADYLFVGISGFSLFLETIRRLDKSPPIPVFWGPESYTGVCTFLKYVAEAKMGWRCEEFEEYKKAHPEDLRYRDQVHHFLYYSRDPERLKKYFENDPGDLDAISGLLDEYDRSYLVGKGEVLRRDVFGLVGGPRNHLLMPGVVKLLRSSLKAPLTNLRKKLFQVTRIVLKGLLPGPVFIKLKNRFYSSRINVSKN